MRRMKMIAGGVLLPPLLAACAGPTPATAPSVPPPTPQVFAGARGAALGNYPAYASGETIPSIFLAQHPDAAPCPVFHWDRPLPDGQVLRLRSASCLIPGSDIRYADIELGRTVIPLADSPLAHGWPLPPPPDVPPTVPVVPPRPAVTTGPTPLAAKH